MKRAYTLIELLVTITIIVILVSLLASGLSRAKSKSKSIVCKNNLKQILLSTVEYVIDNNGEMVSGRYWLCKVPGDLTTGEIYPYLKSRKIYLCPEDAVLLGRNSNITERKYLVTFPPGVWTLFDKMRDYSYGLNAIIPNLKYYDKYTDHTKTVMLMEASYATNDYIGLVWPWQNRYEEALATNHITKGNVGYCDTHVESHSISEYIKKRQNRLYWVPYYYPGNILGANLPDD